MPETNAVSGTQQQFDVFNLYHQSDGGKLVPVTFCLLLADIAIVGSVLVQKDEILAWLQLSQLPVPVSERSTGLVRCGLLYRAFRLIGFVD
jgi:hypothetical protein